MTDPDLTDLLHRATDALEAPGLAVAAREAAGRRRVRRRAAAASVAAAAVVVSTAVLAGSVGADRARIDGPVGVPSSPAPTPSASPSAAPTRTTGSGPAASGRELVEGTQPTWDPRGADDLAPAPAGTVPGLPAVVVAPDSAPALSGAPLDGAVLALQRQDEVLLLGDGGWRSVPLAGSYPRTLLSPAGSLLAVWAYGDLPGDVLTLHEVGTGRTRQVPYPEGFRPYDFQTWAWVDDGTLLLDDGGGGWLVDATTGAATRVQGPSEGAWTVATDGSLVEVSEYTRRAELIDRAGGGERHVRLVASGRLASLQADAGTVVGTSYDDRPFSVLVVDREQARPRAVLPVLDPEANYSNGGLGVLALRADQTVLLRVAVFDRADRGTVRVVGWDPVADSLTLVSTVRKAIDEAVSFADLALRGSS